MKLKRNPILPNPKYMGRRIDFLSPAGEPSLAPADGVSWSVFKNPVSLYIGGITAVLLELAEPRVRSGVWEHSSFRSAPLRRMRRTGLAAMISVYGGQSLARGVIEGVTRMHARVSGHTPDGLAYRADDPDLLNWVHATASFGFLEAFDRFVLPLELSEKDRFLREAQSAAALYGAKGAPTCLAERAALLAEMRPSLQPHDIIDEFLTIVARAPALPWPITSLQRPLIRAAIHILPDRIRDTIGLADTLSRNEARRIGRAARLADRVAIPFSPPVQACRRLGLPGDWLHGAARFRDGLPGLVAPG